MTDVLHGDIEGRSRADLKKEGMYRYAENPSTQILCFAFAFNHEQVCLWIPAYLGLQFDPLFEAHLYEAMQERFPGSKLYIGNLPERVVEHIKSGGEFRAHKADFERTNLNGHPGQAIGFPQIKIEQMVCTKAKCAAHNIPQKLEKAAEALNTHRKDVAGANDMRYFAKPGPKGDFREPIDHPDRFINLCLYCMDDVLAERGVDDAVPDLSPYEAQVVWPMDQRMNQRGWTVDFEAVDDIQDVISQHKAELVQRCVAVTGVKPSQTKELTKWVRANGYPQLENLQAETVLKAALDPDCPETVRKVLQAFSVYNMKAVSKFAAMRRSACSDNRLRGMFEYWGAAPGRWVSKIVQLQNLMRPKIEDPDSAITAFRARDLQWIRDLYMDNDPKKAVSPMMVAASCVRGCLVAAPGHDLIFPDFSGVEARAIAWLFDEEWKLDAFRAFDAKQGPDIYRLEYSRCFAMDIKDVTKSNRQTGKVIVLSLGFGGGVGAFVNMVPIYQIDLDDMARQAWDVIPSEIKDRARDQWEEAKHFNRTYELKRDVYIVCDSIKQLFRQQNPRIARGWYDLQEASIAAVDQPGTVHGLENGKALFKKEGDWLYMRLPSGRRIAYYKPEIKQTKQRNRHGEVKERSTLTYMGVDTYTRRWMRTSTWGGKQSQNWTEGHCRDLLVAAKVDLEKAGYLPIGSIHDEAVLEVPEGFGTWEEVERVMKTPRKFAAGMPIAVEGKRKKRYEK